MIGYRGRWEYSGKFAARLDDVANLIPARLSALLILIATVFCRRDAGGAWRILARDHAKTESPNAGWPMSAMAGALGVRLEKAGHYRLGDGLRKPEPPAIDRAVKLAGATAGLWSVVLIAGEVVKFVIA
jgi:adenosylcobinamide-phosphate synthase